MLLTRTKECLQKTLYKSIPTYLSRKVLQGLKQVRAWNQSQEPYQKLVPVYDILNAGPRHRFAIEGDRQLIVSNCQKTGHDIHMLWVQIFTTMLNDSGIDWKPFIIDWHDESMVECSKADADRVMQIMSVDSYKVLNELLGWTVTMAGEGLIAENLAQAKMD